MQIINKKHSRQITQIDLSNCPEYVYMTFNSNYGFIGMGFNSNNSNTPFSFFSVAHHILVISKECFKSKIL